MSIVYTRGQLEIANELMKDLGVADFVRLSVLEDPDNFVKKFFADGYGCNGLDIMIDRLQKEFGVLIYYITHEETSFGECYSLLYVSTYPEDWLYQKIRRTPDETFIVNAFVFNATDERCSEFGSVLVKNQYGLLERVG